MSANLWAIYCVDEQKFYYQWSVNAPTLCPNNPTDTINTPTVTAISPGSGATGSNQLLFTNNGAITGTSQITFDQNDSLPILTNQNQNPSAPSANTGVKLYSEFKGGRCMPAAIGPYGMQYTFQPGLFNKSVGWYIAGVGTTVTLVNFGNSSTGTATARTVATSSFARSVKRIGYVSSATAGSSTGTRYGTLQFWLGNASGLGGFFYVVRFAMSSASNVVTQRSFVGLAGITTVLTNQDPSLNTNILGFGVDSGDSTWYFMHNDGTGTATKDVLTGTFPPRDLTVSYFEARLYCPSNTTTIFYSLEVLNGGSYYSGSTNSDIPANTQLLAPQIWTNNGTTATAVGIDVSFQYIETDF